RLVTTHMITFKDIKEQDNAIKYLSACIGSGRIPVSFLFSGPEGVGRALTAKALIMSLFCQGKTDGVTPCLSCVVCHKIDSGVHPDVIWIKPHEKNSNIKIEEIRSLRDALNLKPYESSWSVCVIEDAHMMTVSASNALLKIMEEPPGNSLIILITSKKELLLPTVVSRCSEVRFNSLSIKTAKDIIMDKKPDLDERAAYFLAYFSQGAPGKALELAGSEVSKRRDLLMEFMKNIAREKELSCLTWYTEDGDDLIDDIELVIMFLRDIIMAREGLGDRVLDKEIVNTEMYDFFGKYTIGHIYTVVERLINMKNSILGNVNPKLVAQVLPMQFK
ncbi:MAG: DNA polymerase III subunit delta', partial [Candidatus Omnitrophica bacterium]|nr:DNA polymerase III subunit delta' [Candidatus Omnitrophota bacterium]